MTYFLKCAIFLSKCIIISWKFSKIFVLVLYYYAYLLFEMTIKSENPKIRNRQSKVLPNFAIKNFNDHEIQMNDAGISSNWRVSNLQISASSQKNQMYVILSLNYEHSASNINTKFARLLINQFYEIPHLFPDCLSQFSNFLTFPGSPSFPGIVATLDG